MEEELSRFNPLVFVLLGGMVSFGCGGSEPPASDASSVNSPTNTGPDITTGPGAGEPTDSTPDTSNTGANPGTSEGRSTGSTGPSTSSSNEGSSASPVH